MLKTRYAIRQLNFKAKTVMQIQNFHGRTIVYLVTEDWYFLSHRLPMARAAQAAGMRVVVATRVTKHATAIAREGFDLVHVPFNRSGLNPISDLRVLAVVIGCYQNIKPDIVHHVGVKPIFWGQIAAYFTQVPSIVNAMAGMGFLYVSKDKKAKFLRRFFEFSLTFFNQRRAVRLVVQNEDDKLFFENFAALKQKVVLIPGSGVDCKRFSVSPEPDGEIVAVCVSRLLKDKGIYELVEAARKLRALSFPIRIKLIGGTDANPSNISLPVLKGWMCEGLVEVCGPSTDIPGEYSRSHIAVLPSYREGLPKSLLEAAACGRPIVASDVPGCRSICRDGKNGILVPPRDSDAIADALILLSKNPRLRRKMGRSGRKLVLTNFSQEIIGQMTVGLYSELLDI